MKADTKDIQTWLSKNCANLDSFLNQSRLGSVKYLVFYNIIFWSVYTYCNFVIQKDYSRFDLTQIESKMKSLLSEDICILTANSGSIELAREIKTGVESRDSHNDMSVAIIDENEFKSKSKSY